MHGLMEFVGGRALLLDGGAVGGQGGVRLGQAGHGGAVHRLVQVDAAAAVGAGPGPHPIIDGVAMGAERDRGGGGVPGGALLACPGGPGAPGVGRNRVSLLDNLRV